VSALGVFPSSPTNNDSYTVLADSILRPELGICNISNDVTLSDLAHILLTKDSPMVMFSTRHQLGVYLCAIMHSSLCRSILHVVLVRPKKEVVRPNATSIVTMMANAKSTWYRAVGQYPRKTVGSDWNTMLSRKSAIAAPIFVTGPFPASVSWQFIDKGPKSLGYGDVLEDYVVLTSAGNTAISTLAFLSHIRLSAPFADFVKRHILLPKGKPPLAWRLSRASGWPSGAWTKKKRLNPNPRRVQYITGTRSCQGAST
jgi:hypothetical protein